jgi:hypothetical protein
MKYILIIIFTFFSFIIDAQVTYNKVKYYMGDSTVWSSSIDVMAKSGNYIYIGGYSYSSNLTYRTYLAKLDEFGNMINEQVIGSDSVIYYPGVGNSMIVDEDSNVVVVGQTFYKEWNGFVIKLNKNLDTLWNKKYTFPDSLVNYSSDTPRHYFEAIEQTPEGNYIIMGSYFSDSIYTKNNVRPYIMKLNKNGNVLWRKLYPNNLGVFDIAVTSDSGFVFTPHNYSQDEVCKTDSLGNIEWFANANNLLHFVSFDVTVSGDDIISVSPYVYYSDGNPNHNRYGLDFVKTNSVTGQIVWNKQYIPMINVECPTLHQHIEVEIDGNGNIIIAATGHAQNYNHTAGGYKGFLMKLNSNGDSLWTHFYDWGSFFQRYAQFNDFVLTDDGGILAGGYWNPPYLNYKQGAWLVKTDSMGNAPGMFTVGIEENTLLLHKESARIYPNPTKNQLNLDLAKEQQSQMELFIYNSSGSLVSKEILNGAQLKYRVDIKNLSSGVYFLQLISNEAVIFQSKFIKN